MDARLAFILGMLVSWVLCYLLCSRMFKAVNSASFDDQQQRPDSSESWKPEDYQPPWKDKEELD